MIPLTTACPAAPVACPLVSDLEDELVLLSPTSLSSTSSSGAPFCCFLRSYLAFRILFFHLLVICTAAAIVLFCPLPSLFPRADHGLFFSVAGFPFFASVAHAFSFSLSDNFYSYWLCSPHALVGLLCIISYSLHASTTSDRSLCQLLSLSLLLVRFFFLCVVCLRHFHCSPALSLRSLPYLALARAFRSCKHHFSLSLLPFLPTCAHFFSLFLLYA